MSSYGYMPYYKPPPTPRLARAAAPKDPYGLAPNNRPGPLGIGSGTGFAAAAQPAKAPQSIIPGAGTIQRPGDIIPAPPVAGNGAAPTAAGVNHYDLNTDPALQQIQSLVGMSNQQAQSSALKQRQDLLLAYGDPGVAGAVLGTSDPIAQAAGQNPNSTVAQLGQSHDRNVKQLLESLNGQNLGYSGYRVTQEQQVGQDYQNALAQAAAGLNSSLGGVDSNLASLLAGNNQQLVAGINSAADRHAHDTTDPGAGTGDTGPGTTPSLAGYVDELPHGSADTTPPGPLAQAAGGGEASGGAGIQGATAPGVGMTNIDRLYQLLGRKNDPRFGF